MVPQNPAVQLKVCGESCGLQSSMEVMTVTEPFPETLVFAQHSEEPADTGKGGNIGCGEEADNDHANFWRQRKRLR